MNICNGCGHSDNSKSGWVVSGGKKYHKGCIERLLHCKHQHTVIDREALRNGDERFLVCLDCSKEGME